MELSEEKKPLPERILRFSKGMVVLSMGLIAGGFALIMSSWRSSLILGILCLGLGFGIFFTAGYSWGCDNESCS